MNLDPILTRLQALLQSFLAVIPNIIIGIIVFVIFMLIARLIRNAVSAVLTRAGQPRGVVIVLGRVASWVVLTLGFLIAATIIFPTLNAASLFGALGVSSVAIGFAFKDIFQNLLAGILILLTRPFHIGDQIVSGQHEGTVEDIQVRATLLRTYDNRVVVIPNSELYTNRIVVNTAYDMRRISVAVGVGYDDNLEEVKRLIIHELDRIPIVRKDPAPEVLVRSLSDYTVDLIVRYWIDPPVRSEVLNAEDAVLSVLKEAIPAAGFHLPSPPNLVLAESAGGAPAHKSSREVHSGKV